MRLVATRSLSYMFPHFCLFFVDSSVHGKLLFVFFGATMKRGIRPFYATLIFYFFQNMSPSLKRRILLRAALIALCLAYHLTIFL
jgi:hypothetical protein